MTRQIAKREAKPELTWFAPGATPQREPSSQQLLALFPEHPA
jgi:hypothetical protein